jgi:glycosyltransferase involved in cell wall biosynthesis
LDFPGALLRLKKICLIVQNSYPSDVRVRKEADALRARGHEVFVIACRAPNEPKKEVVNGVKIYRVPPSKCRGGKVRYIYEYAVFFLFAFLGLNILDFKFKIDVVHINTLPDFLVFCSIIQKLKGRKIILDMHEIMPEFFISKFAAYPDSSVVKSLLFLERASLRFADRIITVNHALKEVFQNRAVPGKIVEVIMNTVDGNVLRQVESTPHQTFNCVYHGTITEMYGLDVALTAFSKARTATNNMCFHIFGDGPQLGHLKCCAKRLDIENSVKFHGMVPYDKINEMLANMDLGILALRKDIFLNLSFSNKLAEYVHLTIPVVHSDLDSIRYYFNDEEILYFTAGCADDLAEKIRYAYDHREDMRLRAKAAYAKYTSIDWSVMSMRYIRIIEGI